MPADAPEITEDAVLGGCLRLRQPRRGHRVGHDAILLAAATAAQPGEQAIDLGSGVGAAGLALAARVRGLKVALVEIDPHLCALAAANIALNRLDERVRVVHGDAEDAPGLAGLLPGTIDRVLMNPPFNDGRRTQASPDPHRRLAHSAGVDLLPRWIATAATLLKPSGILTLIWRADGLSDVRAALGGQFGNVALLPVLPRDGAPAIRVLLRAVKGAQGADRDYAALVLNDAQNRPTAAAEAVLRGAGTLSLAAL